MDRVMTQLDSERGRWAWIALLCAFALLVLPVILWGADTTSESDDQNRHHLVVIREATASLTGADGAPPLGTFLRDYPSATSPGYHLALAALDACGLGSTTALRLISSLFGLALLLSLWSTLARWVDGSLALALTLPLLASPYFLSGSMWLTTDVAAVWLTVLTLGALLSAPGSSPRFVRAGVFATLAVLVRQPTIWLVAPIFLAAWMSRQSLPASRGQRLATIATLVLPVAAVGGLILLWGGIMPPAYRSLHNSGINAATLAFGLSLIALWGAPWVLALGTNSISGTKKKLLGSAVLFAVVLLAVALPQTDYDRPVGRWGGPLWNAVKIAPLIAGHSLLLIPLAAGGFFVLRRIVLAARRVDVDGNASYHWVIFLAALVSLCSALAVNSQCWERYFDLPLLAILPLGIVLGVDRLDNKQRHRLIVASIVIAILQFALSLWMVYRPTFFDAPLS